MNKFCFGVIYNGRLWEKELRVSAQVKVKIVERNAKSITILLLRTAINFLFPILLAFYVEKQIINFQKRFVVCSVSRKSILLR